MLVLFNVFFFFQAEDGIRDLIVTGVQTCALPISRGPAARLPARVADTASAARAARSRSRLPRSDGEVDLRVDSLGSRYGGGGQPEWGERLHDLRDQRPRHVSLRPRTVGALRHRTGLGGPKGQVELRRRAPVLP